MPYFISNAAIFSSIISPGTARAMHGGHGRLSLAAILPTAFSVSISSVSEKTASLTDIAFSGIAESLSSKAAKPFPKVSSMNFAIRSKSLSVLKGEAMSTAHSSLTYSGSIPCSRSFLPNSSPVISVDFTERVSLAGSTFRTFGASPCSKAL